MSAASSSEIQNHGVVCDCGLPSPVRRSWTRLNPGRRFHGCKGRRHQNGYINCEFFRWYDEGAPTGWQHLALLEARENMQHKRKEIEALTNQVRTLTLNAESDVKSEELGGLGEAPNWSRRLIAWICCCTWRNDDNEVL